MRYKRLLAFFNTREKIIGCGLFILVLAIYTATAARTILPFGDAGALTIAGMNFGLAHPPGYILYTVILWIFIHGIPFGSPAFRAGFANACMQAISVVTAYGIVLYLLENFRIRGFEERIKKKKYKTIFYFSIEKHWGSLRMILAALGALYIAFGSLFWFYSGFPDQFVFADMLFLLLLYISLSLAKYLFKTHFKPIESREEEVEYVSFVKETRVKGQLIAILVLSGLLITFVPDMLFVVPLVWIYTFFVLLRTRYLRRICSRAGITVSILVFLVSLGFPLLLVYLVHLFPHDLSWNVGNDMQSLWGYISGGSYTANGSFSFSSLTLDNIQKNLSVYLHSLQSVISAIPLLLIGVSIIYMLFRNRRFFIYLLPLLILSTVPVLFYTAPDASGDAFVYTDALGLIQRHYMLPQLLLLLLVPVGLYALYKFFVLVFSGHTIEMIRGKGDMFASPVIIRVVFLFLVVLGSIGLLARELTANTSSANHNDAAYIEAYAKASLASTDKNSVLLCFSDISCYSYLYEQQANGVRRDVTVVPGQYDLRKTYLDDKPDFQRFYYADNPYDLADIVSWNMYRGRSVYLADNPKDFITFMGLDGQSFFLTPDEYLQKIERKIPDTYKTFNYKEAKEYIAYAQHTGGDNPWRQTVSNFFTRTIINDAYLYWEVGDLDKSRTDANLALSLDKGNTSYRQIAQSLSSYKDTSPYQHGREAYSTDYLYNLGVQGQDKPQNAYLFAQRVTFLDPLNIKGRILLARLYQSGGNFDLAKIEYRNILKLDPNNPDAKEGLKLIS